MAFGIFEGGKSNVSSTSTTVNTDSFNRSFGYSSNVADSNNLSIAVGSDANPFTKSGDALQRSALYVLGALVIAALLAWVAVRWKK